MLGLTRGTRHYIQYQLTDEEGWQDLLFVDPTTSNIQGLWCSRSYSRANARIEELMTECNTDRSQYRIVRRTWREEIIQHDPNYGKAFNDPSYHDPSMDSGVFQLVVLTHDVSETHEDLSEIDTTITEIESADAEGRVKIRITGTRDAVTAAAQEIGVDVNQVQPFDEDGQDPTEAPYTATDENPEK